MKATPALTMTLALLLAASAAADDGPARVTQLQWMTGCWGFSGSGSSYEEVWLAPTGNSMLGLSRRISDDNYTREFEFLRVVTSGGGGFDYVAQPQGQPPTKFNMLELKGTRVVFENPDHDFPQRIIYEFHAPDQLNARIEGKDPGSGQQTGINFPLRKKTCGS
ncbi:MAG TPA: DUF6265 family protein [Nevskiaceae bacterium]|nr:DUF6265 family protein [Nevskiaceae bacterium]